MSNPSKILIVDDELNIRRILQMAFEKVGLQVSVAEDAHNALQLLENNKFDLIITDVTMPGMNGYELQKIVHENQPDIPVIIMTAYGTIPQAVAAIRRHFNIKQNVHASARADSRFRLNREPHERENTLGLIGGEIARSEQGVQPCK